MQQLSHSLSELQTIDGSMLLAKVALFIHEEQHCLALNKNLNCCP